MALDLSSGGIINPPLWDSADPSKGLTFDFSAMATATRHTLVFDTVAATNITSTFPNTASDTIVMNAVAATLTNKTMTSNTNNLLARGLFVNSGAASVSSFVAAVPSANQVLKTNSTTTMTYVTQNLATTLVDGNSSGNTNLQMTGTGNIVLTTTNNAIISSPSVLLNILAGNSTVAAVAGGSLELDAGDGLTTGAGGNVSIAAGKSPSGAGGSIFLSAGTGPTANGFINFQGFPYSSNIGTPTLTGGGGSCTLAVGSTNYAGGVSQIQNGTTCTITYSTAMAVGKRSRVFLTLVGVSASTTPLLRVSADDNTGFSVQNFSATAGVQSFNYLVIAWN
jgi:hypothetical protein